MRTKGSRKIALFGGTFDPVHNGHLFIAETAAQQCGLDEVIFIPCWQSPHKQDREISPVDDRIGMLELALADKEWASLSTWEIERDEPSYSWMTAQHFANEHDDCELYWLLGADQWNVIGTWARPDLLAKLLTFIVFPRDGVEPVDQPAFEWQTIDVETPGSGTEIRAAVATGRPINDLVPKTVAEYISKQHLYE